VVDLRGDGYVALKSTAFVPQEGLRESFHFLAASVSDHLSAAVHNLKPGRQGPALLDQSAFSQDLSAAQAQQLQQQARRLWASALQQFLQTATVAEERSQNTKGARHRVRFGVYFQEAPQSPAESASAVGAKPQKINRKKTS
jgi:hypothetical protein